MKNLKVLRSLIISSVLMLMLTVGISLNMRLPNSSVSINKNEDVLGVGVVAEEDEAVLWSGNVGIGDDLLKVVLPFNSWGPLKNHLAKDALLEVKRADIEKPVLATIKEVDNVCYGLDVCNYSYEVFFSEEILPLTRNKAKEMIFTFKAPRLAN